jgi:hypothetical protein
LAVEVEGFDGWEFGSVAQRDYFLIHPVLGDLQVVVPLGQFFFKLSDVDLVSKQVHVDLNRLEIVAYLLV